MLLKIFILQNNARAFNVVVKDINGYLLMNKKYIVIIFGYPKIISKLIYNGFN
jgi:hypothetical protein